MDLGIQAVLMKLFEDTKVAKNSDSENIGTKKASVKMIQIYLCMFSCFG